MIRRSIHKLISWKEKLAFLFSCTEYIFPLCLGTARQAAIQVQVIPRGTWNQWGSSQGSLSRFPCQLY